MIKRMLRKWLGVRMVPVDPLAPVPPKPRSILWKNLQYNMPGAPVEAPRFVPPELPKGVVPDKVRMAQDDACASVFDYLNSCVPDQMMFPGYANLAQQAQRPEFRRMTEIIATEMTREWIKVTGSPDDSKADKVREIEAALINFKVKEVFKEAFEHDGFFGCGHIYIDVDMPNGTAARINDDELKTPLMLTKSKIAKGALRAFRTVEPQWCYPYQYNSDDPLRDDFYKPQSWFVMGRQLHASRLMTIVSREVPDILKPAYNFGGLSLTQIADPYVANWIRTRDSVGDLIHSFSINGIKTDMSALLADGATTNLSTRVGYFTTMRDNKGLFVMDKETEDFFQYNVPLSGLDKLQAQAQEQNASVSGIPLVKLLGITPTGLNASSEGEFRVFYDWIAALQTANFAQPLTTALQVIQLHLYGEIDPDIGFEFIPLYQPTPTEIAANNKTKAERDDILIQAGVISQDEARVRLQTDPEGDYTNIELNQADTDIGGEGLEDDDAPTA